MSQALEFTWPLTRDCADLLTVRVKVGLWGWSVLTARLNGTSLPSLPDNNGGVAACVFTCRGQSYELRWRISEVDGGCIAIGLKARGHVIGQWGPVSAVNALFAARTGGTWRSVVMALVAVPIGLGVVAAAFLLADRLSRFGPPGTVGPGLASPFTAHFVVEEQAANDSCSALFFPCVEVVCAVRNDGGVDGVATVETTMSQAGRASVTKVQTLAVAARGVGRGPLVPRPRGLTEIRLRPDSPPSRGQDRHDRVSCEPSRP